MIRNIFLSVAFIFVALVTLNAEPQASSKKAKKETTAASTTSPTAGWSLVKGTWTHSDGYKYVNGQVVRIGPQAHKPVPKPPTKAELNSTGGAATTSSSTRTPATKATDRESAPLSTGPKQIGSHL